MEVSSYLYQSPYSSPVQYGKVDTNTQKSEEQQPSDKLSDSSQSAQNAQASGTSQTTDTTSAASSSSKLDLYA